MFQTDTDRTLTQLLLSLWSGSTRRVEALPKVREYLPSERVSLVPMRELCSGIVNGVFTVCECESEAL